MQNIVHHCKNIHTLEIYMIEPYNLYQSLNIIEFGRHIVNGYEYYSNFFRFQKQIL